MPLPKTAPIKTPKYTALNATVTWVQKCEAINYATKNEMSLSRLVRMALAQFLGMAK